MISEKLIIAQRVFNEYFDHPSTKQKSRVLSDLSLHGKSGHALCCWFTTINEPDFDFIQNYCHSQSFTYNLSWTKRGYIVMEIMEANPTVAIPPTKTVQDNV